MKRRRAMACLSLSVCTLLSTPLVGHAAELQETGGTNFYGGCKI